MWTIKEMFGVEYKSAKPYIFGVSCVYIIFNVIIYAIMLGDRKFLHYFTEYYKNLSVDDEKTPSNVYAALLIFHITLNIVTFIVSLMLYVAKKKKWVFVSWIVFHAFLVFGDLISTHTIFEYLQVDFRYFPSAVYALINAKLMAAGFYVFVWWAVLDYYLEKKQADWDSD